MKNNLVFLAQVEVEPPALVRETLTDDVFRKLNMQPIPLRMFDGREEWAGHCPFQKYTENNEVVISSKYLQEERTISEESRKRDILDIYLHEVAHRLDKNSGHTATFFAINILLRLRLGEEYLIDRIHCYDFKDEEYSPDVYGWAWNVASELNLAAYSIEQSADIIHSRQQSYLSELEETKDRLRSAERDGEASHQKTEELLNKITVIQKINYRYFISGLFIGAFIFAAFQFYLQ